VPSRKSRIASATRCDGNESLSLPSSLSLSIRRPNFSPSARGDDFEKTCAFLFPRYRAGGSISGRP
jgi:hypothetical protein